MSGGSDAFIARLNSTLTTLLQATYLGGSGGENPFGIAVHPTGGEILIAGYTSSTDFPGTADGAQPAMSGGGDVFVARLNPTLTTLLQATYLGGGGLVETARSIVVHPTSGEVLVVGDTDSTDFPGTAGGAQPAFGGGSGLSGGDAFIARLNSTLATLLQATYLGGSGVEYPSGIAVHPTSGEILVAGGTASTDFPGTAGGAQPAMNGGGDGFVAQLDSTLTTLLQATYLGGSLGDFVFAVLPSSGEVLVAGTTSSSNFPGTAGGAQPTQGSAFFFDGFAARLTPDLAALPNLSFFTLTPCRLVDTRTADPPALAAAVDRVFTPAGKCGIPASAQALSVNVTITQPSAAGHIRLYPTGTPRPLVSTSNYSAGQTRANNAILRLGNGGAFAVFCGQTTGTVQFIVDVNGYFE